MRCKNCPYEDYDYQEHYPTCKLFGDDEDYIYENAKGELGCRFNRKGLQRFIKQHEEDEKVIVQQMGDFAKFSEEYDRHVDSKDIDSLRNAIIGGTCEAIKCPKSLLTDPPKDIDPHKQQAYVNAISKLLYPPKDN